MKFRNILCAFALLTVIAILPALAAGAPAAKPKPVGTTIQLADVPMRGLAADDPSAITVQATSEDNVGFHPEELLEPKACPQGGNATFTWTIGDRCGDGVGIYVRFFDETNNLIFPNSSQAYVINSGRTSKIKLSVKRGAKICYGAESTDFELYWGVGLDDDQGCSNCCNIVPNSGNISRSVNLICN